MRPLSTLLPRVRALVVFLVASAPTLGWISCGNGASNGHPPEADASGLLDDASDAADGSVEDSNPPSDAFDAASEPSIFAHTTRELYRFDPKTHAVTLVGTFGCAAAQVFNIAVNKDGQIYGVTSQGLVTIDSSTAACFPVASGVYPHALTFLPSGVLDPSREVLVGYSFQEYVRIDEITGVVTPIGALDPNALGAQLFISGDLVALPNGRLFATVLGGGGGDLLIEADPLTGKASSVQGSLGEDGVLGLAQWAGVGYAFTVNGHVYSAGLTNGGVKRVFPLPPDGGDAATWDAAAVIPFVGAGVTTSAPAK